MFTGIVENTGTVRAVEDTAGGRRLRIGYDLGHAGEGASIGVSGVCLTVETYGDDWFEVFVAEETRETTYLGRVTAGDVVNVERALRADDRLDGHIVQGHVDTTTAVRAIERIGDDWRFTFDLPASYERYVVDKGSIALDGISLTVADRDAETFDVAIIPTTYDLTTLSAKEPGDPVHVEVDVIAKYAERLFEGYADRLLPDDGAGSP